MRVAVLVALALIAAPLSGCLGGDGSDAEPAEADQPDTPEDLAPKRFDVRHVEQVRVPSSIDGKELDNAVYRPDTNESVPVFINFSPYWGDRADERGDPFAQYMIDEYVPRGYAVVLSAIRGTGHSEGCFQIGSDKEIQDLYDVIDHFADADWSNGNVIAGGKSYDSTSQNGLIAKTPHPDLEGIFHVSGISDMYRYTYRMGVPYFHGPIFNTYYYGQGLHEYGLPGGFGTGAPAGASSMDDEGADSLTRALDDAACTEFPEEQAHGIGSGIHGAKTGYWTERDWNRYVGQSDWNGSIFFVHGLQDWNVKPDHILPWLDRLPEDVAVKGWLHQNTENLGHVYPMRTDWNATMLRWLEHVGKDKDTGIEWGFEAEGTDGFWRASQDWPPTSVETVDAELDAEDTSSTLDPANVTATVQLEQANATLRFAGQPTLTVTATSSTADPVLTAQLYEKETGSLTWLNQAVLRGVYRGGLEDPDPVPVGEPVTYNLTFYPQDDVVEPGNELVLRLGENPRFGVPLYAQVEAVSYDLSDAQLALPLAPTDTAVERQPEPTTCFAC